MLSSAINQYLSCRENVCIKLEKDHVFRYDFRDPLSLFRRELGAVPQSERLERHRIVLRDLFAVLHVERTFLHIKNNSLSIRETAQNASLMF